MTGRRLVGSPRRQPSILPSRVPKTTVLNVSWGARTKETLCKPKEGQNKRLTTGLPAVYYRDEKGSSFLPADQCADAYLIL